MRTTSNCIKLNREPLNLRYRLAAAALAWLLVVVALTRSFVMSAAALAGPAGTVDDGLTALAAGCGLAVLAWFGLVTATTALALLLPHGTAGARRARRWAESLAPAAVRRLVAAVLGAALAGGLTAGPACADPGPVFTVATAPRVAGDLDPSWTTTPSTAPSAGVAPSAGAGVPDAALDPAWGAPHRHRPGVTPEETLTVRRGDTLWDIAARHLGPTATDAEISAAWQGWFTANREVIGPDPDRILPGQRLRPPTTTGGPA